MKEQARFWFVHARTGREAVNLAVAAFTEASARRQARKRLGPHVTIEEVSPVVYAHAWVIDPAWRPENPLTVGEAHVASTVTD